MTTTPDESDAGRRAKGAGRGARPSNAALRLVSSRGHALPIQPDSMGTRKPLSPSEQEDLARQLEQNPNLLRRFLKMPGIRRANSVAQAGEVLEKCWESGSSSVDQIGKSMLGTFAAATIDDALERMKPHDPAEEMLVEQLVWVHARIGHLTRRANHQTGLKQLQVVTDALEKAHNTYRRLLLSLSEYRNPKVARNFTAFKQVNLADQQIVQNNGGRPTGASLQPDRKSSGGNATNEKG